MSRADKNEAITKADMATFQEERQNLETDLLDEVLKSRRAAWWVATGLGALAGVALAVTGFTMYRYSQPVPAHMLVMNTDGTIQQVSLLTPQSSYGDVADTYWVSTFIRHYESYEFNTAQADYDATRLMAAPDVAEDYQKRYKWGTKEAMDKTVGDRKSVKVKVSSVILDRETGIATVRFSTTEKYRTRGADEAPQYWIATLSYRYDNMELTAAQRYINPAGFRVYSYRVNAESVANGGSR
ncbi:TPA: virB8 family protein [Pseudomonas aeruginosa]|jgi:type IV secretion system protein VirB8|uniref:Type IV secretion system protein VirB8 n=3 Tax=Pseudomonas TaxID=286 RepID=A0A7X2CJZ8_9PSED|nr:MULTISPECIES: type IV secretion system protein [Pseudomonas]KSO60565.1 type IV secretion system protein VirB8 [Pseudomonas aeruginosa]MBH9345104.1 type IV secretion system protein [Pseudomonas aeruginosa]MBH9399075.1 type IV secretion system protein [Pseudomonas aeruginosa]MBI7349453.1 type IV secretion system protein [Pseudomonas aeruginosa]MBI7373826.1 type IV secretion system protein [Pseudomonas aeruginosa]